MRNRRHLLTTMVAASLGTTEKLDMNNGAKDLKQLHDWLEDWPRLRKLELDPRGRFLNTYLAQLFG